MAVAMATPGKEGLIRSSNLLASGAIRNKKLIPKGKPSDADLVKVAEHLGARLKTTYLIGNEIKPDWDAYRATHNELYTLIAGAMDPLSKTRLMTLVWLRAHQNQAAYKDYPKESSP